MPSSNSALPRFVARANEMTTMAQSGSTSITRRNVVAGLAVTAAPIGMLTAADDAHAQSAQTTPEKSLYDRLGGVFAIAAVVDHFSDAVVKNPIVGQRSKNPQLREWHTKNLANGGDYEPTLAAMTKNRGDCVEIAIRDNGTGIPADVKEKMFNPFFTTKPAGEGTGLGLSISHDIVVKQHGGSIEVDTQPGEFTEIRIALPRTAAPISS